MSEWADRDIVQVPMSPWKTLRSYSPCLGVFFSKLTHKLGTHVLGGGETKNGETRHAACPSSPGNVYVTWGPPNTRT